MKRGTTNSKYLGMTFQGWKVDWAEAVRGGHQRFYLTRVDNQMKQVLTLRDNELTKLSRGEKSIVDLLEAKNTLALRGVNAYHNTIHEYAI